MAEARAVVITGGGSGIGAAAARAFAAAGHRVVVADIDEDAAASVAREIGSRAVPCQVDVRDDARVRALFERAIDVFGQVDAVCVNAGVNLTDMPLVDTNNEKIDTLLAVNLRGAILTTRAAIPYLPDGGAIVFTSSTAGQVAYPEGAVYASTKIALIGLARSLVLELAPLGIRVNCVCPGGVDTPLLRGLIDDDALSGWVAEHPLNRVAKPEDIAGAIVFLATAPHVNGVALRVDGGEAVKGAW